MPELPWVTLAREGALILDEFLRGSRSLLKGCNIAKKTPCDNAKKHPATTPKWEKYSHNDGGKTSYTRAARHHTTACVPRGGLNSPTSDGTLEAPKAPAASQKRPLLQKSARRNQPPNVD